MRFQGGGGTDFDVAVGAFSRRVENKIIFTDGWASMPYKPCDCIWVVFGYQIINPTGGKVIYVDEKELYKNKIKKRIWIYFDKIMGNYGKEKLSIREFN